MMMTKTNTTNGIIDASIAVVASIQNFPFVWHMKMCGIPVKLHFKKEKKMLSIRISFQYVDMRIEHGFEISYDLH